MTEFITSTNNSQKTLENNPIRKSWIIALYFFSIGGIAVGLIGLSLKILSLFEASETAKHLTTVSTLMIIVAFPLIMFGAHAMDKIAAIDKNLEE